MMRAIVSGFLLIFANTAFAQSTAVLQAFEVGSVKPTKMSNIEATKGGEHIDSSPASLTMRGVSLATCLKWAYDVKDYQISGPAWMGSDRFDIVAKAADPTPESQMRLMLQSLLADRFKLTLHREQREMQVYALIQGKNPPKLRKSETNSEAGVKITGNNVTFPGFSMEQLAGLLTKQMDRPVLDMTGLTGQFDFTIDVSASLDDSPQRADLSPIVKAKMLFGRGLLPIVQEQLGLKVEARKLPAEMLVIDRAERIPTEN